MSDDKKVQDDVASANVAEDVTKNVSLLHAETQKATEDTGALQGTAKTKLSFKQLLKKHWMIVLGLVLVAALVISATSIGAWYFGNNFSGYSATKLEIGMKRKDVVNLMGTPDKFSNDADIWIEGNALKLETKIKTLQERIDNKKLDVMEGEALIAKERKKLTEMHFKYIEVNYKKAEDGAGDVVASFAYDSNHKYIDGFNGADTWEPKEFKKARYSAESYYFPYSDDVSYIVFYQDGSLISAPFVALVDETNQSEMEALFAEKAVLKGNDYLNWNRVPFSQRFTLSSFMELNGFLIDRGQLTRYTATEGITDITIPSVVHTIKRDAFQDENITSIHIPEGVTTIEHNAFYGCTSLTSITVAAENTAYFSQDGILYNKEKTNIITVPDAIQGAVTIPDGITQIRGSLFYNRSKLTQVNLPDGLTSIGDRAFEGCGGIASIKIPSSVTTIGSWAFFNHNSLIIQAETAARPIGWDNNWENAFAVIWDSNHNDIAEDGNIYYTAESGLRYAIKNDVATLIIQPNIFGAALEIPAEISYRKKSYAVTSIADRAFANFTSLTSITIPSSITKIGYSAFINCDNLTKVNIGDIAVWCGIDFNGSMSNPLYYAHNLYLNDVLVTNLVIPDGVTNINGYAFSGCSSITSITISGNVTLVDYNAFSGDYITDVVILDGVTNIADNAFYDFKKVTSVTIPSSIKKIGSKAFFNCNSLTKVNISDIAAWCSIDFSKEWSNPLYHARNLYLNDVLVTNLEIPDGVTKINGYAFNGCSSITSITISSNVLEIGSYAFSGCNNITDVVIPEGVTKISNDAFSDCKKLTSIAFPASITNISSAMLVGSNQLERITVAEGNQKYYSSGNCVITKGYNQTLVLGCKSSVIPSDGNVVNIDSFAFAGCTGLVNIILPFGLKQIYNSAFGGCSNLVSIVLPESLTWIGSHAFSGCSSLNNIVIPNGVRNIANSTFSSCSSLTDIVIPNSVISIDHSAFYGCSSLTDIVIPNSVTNIGSSVFYGCSNLENIAIPDSVKTVGTQLFYGTAWLDKQPDGVVYVGKIAYQYKGTMPKNTSITLKDGTISIAPEAFKYNENLAEIIIPNGVTSIGYWAFYNCSALTNVVIPNSVTSIGSNAFYNCSALTSIVIPDSVTSIESSAFYNCSALANITIPNSVTSIGSDAFYGTAWLENQSGKVVYIGEHLYGYSGVMQNNTIITVVKGTKKIGYSAFQNQSGLTAVVIPDSVTKIETYAFRSCTNLTDIIFNGTTEQWNAITKGWSWNDGMEDYTVQCTDGEIQQ